MEDWVMNELYLDVVPETFAAANRYLERGIINENQYDAANSLLSILRRER